jgi:N-dimethylarginine dimethylaminohydrolase
MEAITDANNVLMLAIPDVGLARQQHDGLVEAYRDAGVSVFYVEPCDVPPPNQMFVADLFFMTPEGAILARPASTVRAGEERFVAERLAGLGIPIPRCVRGKGVFYGVSQVAGVNVVSKVQLYVDLFNYPAHGEEAAEIMLRALEKEWAPKES